MVAICYGYNTSKQFTILATSSILLRVSRWRLEVEISEAWKEIWQLQPSQLGGSRRFSADFEVYDERSLDPQNAEVDIYIAIKP